MMARQFLRWVGAVLALVGIIGFFFPLQGYMDLTLTHNLVHLVTGLIAVAVSGNDGVSSLVAKIYGFVYLLVGVVGLFTRDVFGLIMLMPIDTVIHFVLAIGALYVGFAGGAGQQSQTRKVG